jgi:quercetin dioxygenase-like cupin family protein
MPGLSGFAKAADRNKKSTTPKIIRDDKGRVLNVIGDIQTHKLTGTDTGNQIVEWVDNVEPGVGIPPHVHTREDEIFRVIWGEVEIMIDGEATILKAGDTAFAPKNVPHAWKVVGTKKARMITSAFPSGIEDMFEELAQLPAGPPDFEKVTEICGRYGVEFV